jgi:CHAD domain-containing protein
VRAVHLDKYFTKQSMRVQRLGREVKRTPKRSLVHQLRVATRRIQALLWLCQHCDPPRRFKKLEMRLRKLFKVLGPVREIDVAIQDSSKYHAPTNHLQDQRRRKVKAMQRQLDDRKRRKLTHQLNQVGRVLRAQSTLNLHTALEQLRSELSRGEARRHLNADQLHRLRLTVKKARYVMEALGEPVAPLTDIQKMLGKAHDLEILAGYIGRSKRLKKDRDALQSRVAGKVGPALRRYIDGTF